MTFEVGIIKYLETELEKDKDLKPISKPLFEQIVSTILTRYSQEVLKFKKELIENPNKKITKHPTFIILIKELKKELGLLYSCYLLENPTKRERIINACSYEDTEELLALHKSTKERIPYYTEIYSKIFSWYKPKRILDLGCGYNPLSYALITKSLKSSPEYVAVDINAKDMELLSIFAKRNSLPLQSYCFSTLDPKLFTTILDKKEDCIFLFKALDSLEKIEPNATKTIFERITAKHIVVSFPTKSLSSQRNFSAQRNWFIGFLEKNNYQFEIFDIENEKFFLITKN